MKKKELITKIRNQAITEMPDVFNRINLESIQIEENEYEPTRQPLNLRRALSFTFASLFILISGFMIYNFGYLSLINNASPLETETEIIGFQTVSAAALLSINDIAELNSYDSEPIFTELSQSSSSIEDEIELINSYLNLAETVIGDEENYVYNNIESDNTEYAFAFEYKAADLAGNLIEYKAYYNKTTTLDGEEITTGIMINNQKQYNFSSHTIQVGETSTYQYKIYSNNNNYVEVIDTSTEDYQKFSYKVYKNNILYNSSEMKVHSYKKNISATMVITNHSNNQLTLEFERNDDDFDNQEMKVNYSYNQGNNLETGEFNVNLITDSDTGQYKYQYKFSNSNVIVANRSGKGNTKAIDDDFTETKGNKNDNNNTATISTEEETTTEHGNNTNSNDNTSPGNRNGYKGQTIKVDIIEQMEI